VSSDADPPRPDPDPPDLCNMGAVAAGRAARVAEWTEALRRASIRSTVVRPHACSGADGPAQDYVELWVAERDADRANVVLRESDAGGTRPASE
jgi:hypothetical protein